MYQVSNINLRLEKEKPFLTFIFTYISVYLYGVVEASVIFSVPVYFVFLGRYRSRHTVNICLAEAIYYLIRKELPHFWRKKKTVLGYIFIAVNIYVYFIKIYG